MKQTNKLTVPDLITIGVFTALYFVLVTIADFTARMGSYKSKAGIMLRYVLFSYGLFGPAHQAIFTAVVKPDIVPPRQPLCGNPAGGPAAFSVLPFREI